MNADEPSSAEEEVLLTHLVACDEALAAGKPPQEAPSSGTPVELQPRLEGNLACIEVLRKVLPRRDLIDEVQAPTEDMPFQHFGRFHIRRLLGQGSFGMVFLASDPQLSREVALKLPRPEALLTGELRQRFLREARAAAGLDHPNLVPVYEVGAVGPLCYIVSAYCPGTTLGEWLTERTQLSPERLAAELMATLADAVAHAHARGVVHRDLKPSNVLLQGKPRDSADSSSIVNEPGSARDSPAAEWNFIPRITDFGLAKFTADAMTQRGETGGVETQSGAVMGTPNYMAPEQASGKAKEIGPAADIYSLGVILYEVLTGRPPFRGETLLDTLDEVRTGEPLPPRRLRPKLSRDLDTICLRCLQKEPRKRYAGAADLAEDLRRYLAGEPIRARPIRAWERFLKWTRRKPTQAALLMVSVLGALTFAAIVLAYDARLRQGNKDLKNALESTEEKRQEANTNLRFAGMAIEDFATKLGQDKRLLAYNLEDVRKEYLQSAMNMWRQLLKEYPEDPGRQEEYARTLQRFGRLIKEMGAKQEAIDAFQRAVAVSRDRLSKSPGFPQYQDELAAVLNDLGTVYSELRQSGAAEAVYREALNIRQQLASDYSTEPAYQSRLADTHNNLALLYEETGRPDLAETAHRNAQDVWVKLHRDHPKAEEYLSGLVDSYFNLGVMYEDTSRLEQSEKSYNKSCELARELVLDHPILPAHQDALGKALTNLGLVYVETNRAELAVKAYREAEAIYQKLANDHPKIPNYPDNLARVHHNLGQANEHLGQTGLAEAAYSKARDLRKQLMHDYPKIPDYRVALAKTLNNLGGLFCITGRPNKASGPLGESRAIREQLVQQYPDVTSFRVSLGNSYNQLGLMESVEGKHQAALEWLDQSVRILESVLKKEASQTFGREYLNEAYRRRVAALNQLGRYKDALRDLDRLLEIGGGVKSDAWLLLRAESLARMGRYGPAMTEVDALAARPLLSAASLYNLACICSLCSSAVRRDSQMAKDQQEGTAEQYAARAVEFLKKAKATGYFGSVTQLEEMRKDKDLDVLRHRRDFQELFPMPRPNE